MKLKSTDEQCVNLPYIGSGLQPWPTDYRRVLIQRQTKHAKGVVQLVHKSKLKED